MAALNFEFNENISHNIDQIDVSEATIRLRGWIVAEIKITKLAAIINNCGEDIYPLNTFGINSSDVERVHGAKGKSCRFNEIIFSNHKEIENIRLAVTLESGRAIEITVYRKSIAARERVGESVKAKLGIGVTTYNRPDSLALLMKKIELHTKTPFDLIVADDGSEKQTIEFLKDTGTPFVTGNNRGVAWNKNRAIYYLNSTRCCDTIILLEDDTYPSVDGWELDWIEATKKYGHLNLAGHWFREKFLGGRGTPDDPIISSATSGQCVSFSRKVIETVGYFDTRFGQYGFEHVEHTNRCIRAGFGGFPETDRLKENRYVLIRGGVTVGHMLDFHFISLLLKNEEIYNMIKDEEIHRWAWRGDGQMQVFLREQSEVMPKQHV